MSPHSSGESSRERENEIVVENLSVSYQTNEVLVSAATDVSFTLRSGESLALWGHSGCGKSSIINAILGIDNGEPGISAGRVYFNGKPVAPDPLHLISTNSKGVIFKQSLAYRRRHVGLLKPWLGIHWRTVFQEPIYSFDPACTLGDQLHQALMRFADGNKKRFCELAVEFRDLLAEFGLDLKQVERRTNLSLSGGECQRVSLALSMVGAPQLLLADEPTTAMDAKTRKLVYEILVAKLKENGTILLLASHNRKEVEQLVDRVLVLYKGHQMEEFSRGRFADSLDAFHPYTQRLWFTADVEDKVDADQGLGESARGCPFAHECPAAKSDSGLLKRCRAERPPLFTLSEDHRSACWLFEDAATGT